jgi:hypothetical protein
VQPCATFILFLQLQIKQGGTVLEGSIGIDRIHPISTAEPKTSTNAEQLTTTTEISKIATKGVQFCCFG